MTFRPTVLPGIAFGTQGRIVVSGHTPGDPPRAASWSAFLAGVDQVFEQSGAEGMLVYANDCSLTPSQRGDLGRLNKKYGHLNAVLTNSTVTRGIVTAIAWFSGPSASRAFRTLDLEPAFDHLKLNASEREAVKSALFAIVRSIKVGNEYFAAAQPSVT